MTRVLRLDRHRSTLLNVWLRPHQSMPVADGGGMGWRTRSLRKRRRATASQAMALARNLVQKAQLILDEGWKMCGSGLGTIVRVDFGLVPLRATTSRRTRGFRRGTSVTNGTTTSAIHSTKSNRNSGRMNHEQDPAAARDLRLPHPRRRPEAARRHLRAGHRVQHVLPGNDRRGGLPRLHRAGHPRQLSLLLGGAFPARPRGVVRGRAGTRAARRCGDPRRL